MNPNAVTFQSRSMYSQQASGAVQGSEYSQQPQEQSQQPQQSHTSSGMDNNKYNDYQGNKIDLAVPLPDRFV